jgi:hypothetical protein
MNINRFKQLLESTMGNVKPLLLEQLTIAPDQTIKLNCKNIQTNTEKPIEGSVDQEVRNASRGSLDSGEYIEPEDNVTEFFVKTMLPPGALGFEQEKAEPVYIEKINQDFKDAFNVTSGYVLTHFENGSRFYCKVIEVSEQLKSELKNNDVDLTT